MPNFIAGHMDDIDALGHNENNKGYDGVPMALTEQCRLENVLDRLKILEDKLGELVDACKATGIYDRMTFVLGTDHGITHLVFNMNCRRIFCQQAREYLYRQRQ